MGNFASPLYLLELIYPSGYYYLLITCSPTYYYLPVIMSIIAQAHTETSNIIKAQPIYITARNTSR